MARSNSSDLQGSYLQSLSLIESNNSVLYTALADRTTVASVKELLRCIAEDGQKHSAMLKGFNRDLVESEAKPRESEKELAAVFGVSYDIYKEIIKKEATPAEELPVLAEKLAVLEGVLDKKYRFVQEKLSLLAKTESLQLLNGLTSDKVRRLFERMVADGAEHRRLLGTVQGLVQVKPSEPGVGFEVLAPMVSRAV